MCVCGWVDDTVGAAAGMPFPVISGRLSANLLPAAVASNVSDVAASVQQWRRQRRHRQRSLSADVATRRQLMGFGPAAY